MFAVIFEVQPKTERWDDYLALAGGLRPVLEAIDGFLENERFASQRTPGRLLSLSLWRDEKAVIRWRTQALHHSAQTQGREGIFADYHLRVGEVVADSAAAAPLPPQRLDATEIGAAKAVTLSVPLLGELPAPGALATELFESITTPGKRLLLAGWPDVAPALAWMAGAAGGAATRHRVVRVIRDYGLADRREAPQYYPPVG